MTDEEAVSRGRRAQAEYAETEAAFEQVRKAILDTLIETSITSPDRILKLHAAVQNLTAVQTALMEVIQNGQLASVAISQAGLTRN